MSCADLLAIRVARRQIAIAAFDGLRLIYTQIHELPSDYLASRESARRFIDWAVASLKPKLVAVERMQGTNMRAADLHAVVLRSLARSPTTRATIDPNVVFSSFGISTPKQRAEVRAVARRIWPELSRRFIQPTALDAALLGLHLQVQMQFSDK